jgi:hypothetical protein
MSHHHTHNHNENMTFKEKSIILIKHWIKHNEEHAASYIQRGEEAKQNGYDDLCKTIIEAADMTEKINEKLNAALENLK